MSFFMTSESVGVGHPDKIADQVSDRLVDACLEVDPQSKCAIEVITKTGLILVFGEVTTKAKLDYQRVVREAIKEIGYDHSDKGFDYKTCNVMVAIEEQSADIAQGVHVDRALEEMGAGDQGIMFGYATNETPEMLPLPLILSHKLNIALAAAREDGSLPWLRPDTKTQITVEYEDKPGALKPLRVDTVVVSAQHAEEITLANLKQEIMEKIVKTVIPADLLDNKTIYHIQPSGKFVIGGPCGDSGLTGRKIVVDQYGGFSPVGGGCFSGKDSSKVDRSASYMARTIAKSLIQAQLAERVCVQLSYAIGVAEPLSVHVDTYGTSKLSTAELVAIIRKNFDMRPGAIIKSLGLDKPIFAETAKYGHFTDQTFPWEQPKKLEY